MRTLLIWLVLCGSAFAQTSEELRTYVNVLAADDMGGRKPSSKGMHQAQTYVVKQLQEAGFHPA